LGTIEAKTITLAVMAMAAAATQLRSKGELRARAIFELLPRNALVTVDPGRGAIEEGRWTRF
jgi:hypothetical protein